MLMLTPLLLFASVAALSDSEIPADTVTLPDVVAAAPAKTNVTLLPLNTNIVTEEVIDKSAETSLLPILVNKVPGLFVTEPVSRATEPREVLQEP